MNLEIWHAAGNYFDFQDHRIFYRRSLKDDASEMEATLCLHGFPTASFDYHKIWQPLAEEFPLLAFDMLGYGFSAKPARFNYTTFQQADVLQALLEHLKIKRVHLLAHDCGNTITQELLARRAENRLNFSIESICFLNGALFPETHRPIAAQKILISPLGFIFGKLISNRRFKTSLASIFGAHTKPTEAELDDFLTLFKFNNGRSIAHKLIRYMSERTRFRDRWVGALQEINVPFRFINGSADPVSGAHLVRRFREVVPAQTDIIELAGIGHFPHFETPEKTAELYLKFRQRI